MECVVEHVYDVHQLDEMRLTEFIHEKRLDILIDLNGMTLGMKGLVMAARPAPIQITFLGHPGTMCWNGTQYFVGDRHLFALPERIIQMRNHSKQQSEIDKFLKDRYCEKIIFMPNYVCIISYRDLYSQAHNYNLTGSNHLLPVKTSLSDLFEEKCPNDELLETGTLTPKSSFTFCNFNRAFKWDAKIFDTWMRILKAVPDSVFYMGNDYPITQTALKRRAAQMDVSPSRLVFVPSLKKVEHLARLKYCDLWLDSATRYGSHTLSVDAVWMGLPILTFGHNFVTRVASSVLHTMGVTDTIAADINHYEHLAIYYATNGRSGLRRIKKRLEAARDTSPLFDAELWTRHWEKALKKVVMLHATKGEPEHILVER
eukprot:TRINITY_DN2160_c0_g1_i3.p1 TRINITY_DN2160_c0_g1~~TRINITY_DN2160_c0_g1_i3.p1  ORF type:complete len:372 (+),score=30.09 TRINITY_DN2160_c0_g1_i3:636-1751(+)